MAHPGRTAEEVLAELARNAHGVVARADLLAAGLSPDEIRHRMRTGALLQAHPGVYRVGHQAPSTAADYLAAVRACGPRARLCGLAAAHDYGIWRGRAPRPEVVAPSERRVAGVVTHRARLDPADTTVWNQIPMVTVARALVEIGGRLEAAALARACHEAGVRFRTTPGQVAQALSRWPNAPGSAALRRVMAGDEKVALSRLESRFLELLRRARLPLPVTNRPAGGRRVDCRWPEQRVTVELDSYGFHNSRLAWERDHRREREAYARGDAFRRYTWGDVFEHPAALLQELSELLRSRPA